MRGAFAMPDAECPRCNATQPPPESVLATCPRCGLVFTPREVQHKPPSQHHEPPPVLPGVTVRGTEGRIEVRWSLDRGGALLAAFIVAMAWLVVAVAPVTCLTYAIVAMPTAFVGYALVTSLISDHVLTITPERIAYRVAPWPRLLRRARSFDRDGVTSIQMIRTPNAIAGHHYRVVVRGTAGDRLLCRVQPVAATSIAAFLKAIVPFSRLD